MFDSIVRYFLNILFQGLQFVFSDLFGFFLLLSFVHSIAADVTDGNFSGGLIGGPVARLLINRMGRKPIEQSSSVENTDEQTDDVFEQAKRTRLITAKSAATQIGRAHV